MYQFFVFVCVFFGFTSTPTSSSLPNSATENRSKIGPVLNAPQRFGNSLYFLSATGVLFKSDEKLEKIEKLFQTKKHPMDGIAIESGIAYFGDGLHDDKETTLYAYDLKKNAMKFTKSMPGHIERSPLITAENIYVGLGPSGIMALSSKTLKTLWHQTQIDGKNLHIDASPILYKDKLCFTSVYTYKAFICLNAQTGKKDFSIELKASPKSEIAFDGNKAWGLMTEANLVEPKWETPSWFYVIDLGKSKKTVEVQLRGYNFWPPIQIPFNPKEVFAAISTGDLITIDLDTGKINFVGQVQEPFVSSPFLKNNQFCAAGVMGKMVCFAKEPDGPHYKIASEERLPENIVGKISIIGLKFYIPTRSGYVLWQ